MLLDHETGWGALPSRRTWRERSWIWPGIPGTSGWDRSRQTLNLPGGLYSSFGLGSVWDSSGIAGGWQGRRMSGPPCLACWNFWGYIFHRPTRVSRAQTPHSIPRTHIHTHVKDTLCHMNSHCPTKPHLQHTPGQMPPLSTSPSPSRSFSFTEINQATCSWEMRWHFPIMRAMGGKEGITVFPGPAIDRDWHFPLLSQNVHVLLHLSCHVCVWVCVV